MSHLCLIHQRLSCSCILGTLLAVAIIPSAAAEFSQWSRLTMLLSLMIASSVCDIAERRIPNALTYTSMLCAVGLMLLTALLVNPTSSGLALGDALLGWSVCGSVTLVGFHFGRMGGGDVKMAAALGSLMGAAPALSAFLVGHLFAAAYVLCGLVCLRILQHIQPVFAAMPLGRSPIGRLLSMPASGRIDCSTKIPMAGFYSLGALAVLLSDLLVP